MVKNPPAMQEMKEVTGLIPRLSRAPGEGDGNSLQYSCLGNPMDRGAWWATEHGVAESWAQLRDYTTVIYSLTDAALLSLIVWVIMEPKQ